MINAIAPWYGSNRMLAREVGKLLHGCEWVGVPFAGGLCELKYIQARTMLVSDLHRHVINLATVIQNDQTRRSLIESIEQTPFHPGALEMAQERIRIRDRVSTNFWRMPDLQDAIDYFVCSWMARNGVAGTKTELNAGISTRWDSGGGDSVVRFRNAGASLDEWAEIMRGCSFEVLDVFDFLGRVKDKKEHGLYLDPPFHGKVGDKYLHQFTSGNHEALAFRLRGYLNCRIVVRMYDSAFVREHYPVDRWKWHHLEGRDQANNDKKPEVLLVLNGE